MQAFYWNVLAFSGMNLRLLQHMIKLDAVNNRILHELTADGRVSNAELAERVGLSASACLRRVQELERTGVIKGYRAVLDRAALGTGFTAFITVGLSDHTKASQKAFEESIVTSPEVRECHNITGSVEYLLRVEVDSLEDYKAFHADTLGVLSQVASITSHICLGSSKDMRG